MSTKSEIDGLAKAIIERGMALATSAHNSGGWNITNNAAATYQDWTFGRAPSTPLPRDGRTFLEGAFGPLVPATATAIDNPQDGSERAEPRRWEYPVAWNTNRQPGSEGLKLAQFVQLRAYADLYSLVRAAIEVRKQEILGIEWEIVPTRRKQLEFKANPEGQREWEARKDMATAFFRRPDPDYPNYQGWMSAFLEDLFVVDAPTLYLHPPRLKGHGVLGSDLAALEVIDGTTIRPMLDLRGGRPAAPNPAYQQYLWGVPRTDLMQVMTGQDVSGLEITPVETYRADQLMYLPYLRRSWTPYGFPGIERGLIPVVTGLKKQQFALEFFTEGSLPGMFVIPGPGIDTPQQIRGLQDSLNFLAGDQAWKHKIIVLPHGSSTDKHKNPELATAFDEVVAVEVCMAYEVQPDEIGFPMGMHAKGLTIGGSAAAADSADEARQRKATKPLLKWLKDTIFNPILQGVCGQEDMEWAWVGWQDEENQAAVAARLLSDVKLGAMTLDEYRKEFGREPYGFPSTAEPLIISERGIVVPLAHLDTAAIADTINDPIGLDAEKGDGATPDDAGAAAAKPGKDTPGGSKAALAELEKLRRFMKKGRSAAEWTAEHLPQELLDDIADGDLTISDARARLRG